MTQFDFHKCSNLWSTGKLDIVLLGKPQASAVAVSSFLFYFAESTAHQYTSKQTKRDISIFSLIFPAISYIDVSGIHCAL
jgi:hypothetical protein